MIDDDIAVLVFEIPNTFEKLFAPEIAAAHTLGLTHLALDPRLSRDAGMVGAGQPHYFLAILPRPAGEDVLQRIVQDMA